MEGLLRNLILFLAPLLINVGLWRFFKGVEEELKALERKRVSLVRQIERKERELKRAIELAKKRKEIIRKYVRFARMVPVVDENDRNLFILDFTRQIRFQGLSVGKAKYEFSHGKGENKVAVWTIPFSYTYTAPWPEVLEDLTDVGGLQTPFVIDRVSLTPEKDGKIKVQVKGRLFFFVQ